jgi:hypothetical protein
MTETKTYPDGSQRVGCAPFPELSPLQEQEAALRGPEKATAQTEVVTVETKPRAKPGPKPKAAQE